MDFFRKNLLSFSLHITFWTLGLMGLFFSKRGDLLLWFNERHTTFLDGVFLKWTVLGEWPAFVIIGLFFLARRSTKFFAIPILGMLVGVCSYFLKSFFAHRRPGYVLKKEGLLEHLELVEGVYINMGPSSFPSGHSFAAFALFAFLAFSYPQKYGLVIFSFFLALGVGLSRVYLVQHFFEDILFGSFLGFIAAVVVYQLTFHFSNNQSKGQTAQNTWFIP